MAKNADAETGRQNRATDGLSTMWCASFYLVLKESELRPSTDFTEIYRPLLDSLLTSKDAASLTDRDIRDEIDTFMVAVSQSRSSYYTNSKAKANL